MVVHMGWILLGYVMAALLVHLSYGRLRRQPPENSGRTHYILVTRNHGDQMEWYLRALSWYARIRGESVKVTVLDEYSQDDTRRIVQRLRNQPGIELALRSWRASGDAGMSGSGALAEEETLIYVDLRKPQEAAKIPYVQV
ncbi:hypothetical protein [Paenibacillus sp. A14]|uniref:hypothetical protein n=1 Tax=Paenibacillus sp. A14 TaxID=3119820 RepID=UPI002FE3857E